VEGEGDGEDGGGGGAKTAVIAIRPIWSWDWYWGTGGQLQVILSGELVDAYALVPESMNWRHMIPGISWYKHNYVPMNHAFLFPQKGSSKGTLRMARVDNKWPNGQS